MSFNETAIDALKSRLDELILRSSVTQFEGEDIVQLIQEGETIHWIVNQLKANSPAVNVDEFTALLTEIQAVLAPEKAAEPATAQAVEAEPAVESPVEPEPPNEALPDLSQLDLSQLAGMLPPGVKLPPGLDLEQLKNLMESPQGKVMADFALFCQEKGVSIDEGARKSRRTKELQKEWKSTPREAFGGKTPAEMMEGTEDFMGQEVETVRRTEPRVGRNDPCPCGSGKKHKKCCGRI